jgi:hypothetical protein
MGLQWKPVETGQWSGKKHEKYWLARRGAPRIDAYLVWADATGFADIRRNDTAIAWVPLLIELKAGKTTAQFAAMVAKPQFKSWIRVPEVYRNSSVKSLERTRFCTVAVTKEAVGYLQRGDLDKYVARCELGLPTVSPIDADAHEPQPRSPASGRTVVVGTIDDNFAFAHARFRESEAAERFQELKPPTTRIDYLWTQDPAAGPAAQPVPGMGYGREIERSAINTWLEEATRAGTVNEDQVYERARYKDAQKRVAHGTHVMDLCSGADPAKMNGNAHRLVCVQFPSRDNWGAMPLGVQVLDGLRYIIDRADRIAGCRLENGAKPADVVVNLPHANLAGPHDGSSILERAMDDLIVRRREAGCAMEVVLPAGNNHLSRCHARFKVDKGKDAQMDWRILPDDATPNFLEIWLPKGRREADITVHVTPPGSRESDPVESNQVMALRNGRDDILCTVVYLEHAANGDRPMVLLAVAPTSTHRRQHGGTPAPCGVWKVRVSAKTGPLLVEAWIQRDDPVLGKLPYGRQSRFDDPRYVRFDPPYGRPKESDGPERSPVKRVGSINGIATGSKTVVIGGFRRSDGAAARYSGSGRPAVPSRSGSPPVPGIRGPDAMGVSDDYPSTRGVLGAGVRSGCSVAMDGTSVAVARLAGYIADQLQATGAWSFAPAPRAGSRGLAPQDIGHAAVVALARDHERPLRFPKPKPPRERSGEGRAALRPREKR